MIIWKYLLLVTVGSTAAFRVRVDPRDENSRLPKPQFERERSKHDEVKIINFIDHKQDDGSYTFGFEAEDGSYKIETRTANGEVWGQYGYIDTDGILREASYGVQLVHADSGQGVEDSFLNEIPDEQPNLRKMFKLPSKKEQFLKSQQEDKLEHLRARQNINLLSADNSNDKMTTKMFEQEMKNQRFFGPASTEQHTTELKPTEKSANNEIDNLEESFEVATPNLERNDASITIEDTTETFKNANVKDDLILDLLPTNEDSRKYQRLQQPHDIQTEQPKVGKVKIIAEKTINGRRAVLKKKLRRLPVTNFQKQQQKEIVRGRVLEEDKPKSFISKKILQQIEEAAIRREQEKRNRVNSPYGKFEHFPDLSRVNINDDIATTKSAPNFASPTTTARTTLHRNSAAAASINVIETSTVAQRLNAIRNDIDFLESSLELIKNNNVEVNNALDEAFTQDEDIPIIPSATLPELTPEARLPEKEEFMRKNNDLEYSAVKFDFSSDYGSIASTTQRTDPVLVENIDILQMYLDDQNRASVDRMYTPTWYNQDKKSTQQYSGDNNINVQDVQQKPAISAGAGSVQFSFASTKSPDYSDNLQTRAEELELTTPIPARGRQRKPSLIFESGRLPLNQQEVERSDVTAPLEDSIPTSTIRSTSEVTRPSLRFPEIARITSTTTTPKPQESKIEIRHHGNPLTRQEQQTQSPILPRIIDNFRGNLYQTNFSQDKYQTQFDSPSNKEDVKKPTADDFDFPIIPAVPNYPVLLDSFAPDRKTSLSLEDESQ